ncbi:MAG: hypothetical protein ACLTML_00290 [Blautia faecis]
MLKRKKQLEKRAGDVMGDYNKKILAVIDLKKSYVTKGNTYPGLQGINM